MKDRPSEATIDIEGLSQSEPDRRIVPSADSDAIEVDKLGDSVRIDRSPRAQPNDREVLRQPL